MSHSWETFDWKKKYKSMAELGQESPTPSSKEKSEVKELGVVPANALQISGDEQGNDLKRSRGEDEGQTSRDAGPSTGGKKGKVHVGDVLEQFIDLLQAKDIHELFSMPGNLETYNYEESISSPSDFATLRQKHKDGLYPAMEVFENDVISLLRKPIDSNPRSSVPYKEAQKLLSQAKKSFRSFKTNPKAFEVELAAWHKKYFNF